MFGPAVAALQQILQSIRMVLACVAGKLRLLFTGILQLYFNSMTFAGAALQLGNSRWLDLDRGIVTSTPKIHAAIMKAINQGSNCPS